MTVPKHGIFSDVVMEALESPEEFWELVRDLREHFDPAGRLEEILVEKLATIIWRYRRLLRAEASDNTLGAFSAKNKHWEEKRTIREAVEEFGVISIAMSHNTVALRNGLTLLRGVKQRIQRDGLDWERDGQIAVYLYGAETQPTSQTDSNELNEAMRFGFLPYGRWTRVYREWYVVSGSGASKHRRDSKFEKEIIALLTLEVSQLKKKLATWHQSDSWNITLKKQAAMVPGRESVERFARYEATLERSFARTLDQLERLQRIRRGDSVPPPLKVSLS